MSNLYVVSLITEGESSVVKRYFKRLENGRPLFASKKKRLSTRRDSHRRGTVSAGPAITAGS